MRCAGIPAYDVQRLTFIKQNENDEFTIFLAFLCIFDGFLHFWGCFFCGKLTKLCRHARTFQWVSQQSLASINNKNPTILTKRSYVATTVPSGTQRHHWGIGIHVIPFRVFDPGPSNSSIFLGLCSPGDQRQSIESPMCVLTFNSTEKALTYTIHDCILRTRPKKVRYLTKVIPLDVELI